MSKDYSTSSILFTAIINAIITTIIDAAITTIIDAIITTIIDDDDSIRSSDSSNAADE